MRPSKNIELMQALAVEIKVRREKLGYTQEDLAGKCELDRPYISLIEVGKKQPTISVLLRLAQGLGLPLGVFMRKVERRYALNAKVLKNSL